MKVQTMLSSSSVPAITSFNITECFSAAVNSPYKQCLLYYVIYYAMDLIDGSESVLTIESLNRRTREHFQDKYTTLA